MYSNLTACLGCGDDVRRCTNTTAILCADAHVPDAAVNTPTDDPRVTTLSMNHAVKCTDFTTPETVVCTTNYALCVETRWGLSITCNNATLDGECVRKEEWTWHTSTHSPLVCGSDAFFRTARACRARSCMAGSAVSATNVSASTARVHTSSMAVCAALVLSMLGQTGACARRVMQAPSRSTRRTAPRWASAPSAPTGWRLPAAPAGRSRGALREGGPLGAVRGYLKPGMSAGHAGSSMRRAMTTR